jgi:uncharacterized protein (TIGR00369 family)
MAKKSGASSALCARVEHALALNRTAKLNFPGIMMGLVGRQIDAEAIELEFDDGPWSRDGRGELNWPALGVVIDIALGTVTRLESGPTMRPATVQLQVQMTGASTQGHLVTHARFTGRSEGTALKHVLAAGTVTSGETVIAHASGAFVMLDLPEGTTQTPMPWVPEGVSAELDASIELDDYERAAVLRCRQAERAATPEHPFIEHFWCGVPTAADGKARLNVKVAPHLGNRVGQVHGGVLLGLAARVSSAAVPQTMMLSNISVWYISPGLGPNLKVRSAVVQQGRNLAVVRTQIVGEQGKLVLEATSQHVALSS